MPGPSSALSCGMCTLGSNWHTSFCCPWLQVLELPALTEFEVALFDNRVGEAAESDGFFVQDVQDVQSEKQDGARQMATTMRGLRKLMPWIRPFEVTTGKHCLLPLLRLSRLVLGLNRNAVCT